MSKKQQKTTVRISSRKRYGSDRMKLMLNDRRFTPTCYEQFHQIIFVDSTVLENNNQQRRCKHRPTFEIYLVA